MGNLSKDWHAIAVPIILVVLLGCGTTSVKTLSPSTLFVPVTLG
jgi:hypothetical protein